jgi:hypothetical protein
MGGEEDKKGSTRRGGESTLGLKVTKGALHRIHTCSSARCSTRIAVTSLSACSTRRLRPLWARPSARSHRELRWRRMRAKALLR